MDELTWDEEQEALEHDEEMRASDYRTLIAGCDNGNDFASISSHVVSLGKPVVYGKTRVWAECQDYHPSHGRARDVIRVSVVYDPDMNDVIWKVTEGPASFSKEERVLFTGSFNALVNRLLGKE